MENFSTQSGWSRKEKLSTHRIEVCRRAGLRQNSNDDLRPGFLCRSGHCLALSGPGASLRNSFRPYAVLTFLSVHSQWEFSRIPKENLISSHWLCWSHMPISQLIRVVRENKMCWLAYPWITRPPESSMESTPQNHRGWQQVKRGCSKMTCWLAINKRGSLSLKEGSYTILPAVLSASLPILE